MLHDDRGHPVEVVPRVTSASCLKVSLVQDAGRRQLHSQPCCSIEPFHVCRIAAKELIPRPKQRIQVQHNRRLPCGFSVGKHRVQRDAGPVQLKKIHRGRDRSDDWKLGGMPKCQLQNALTAHTDAQESNMRRTDSEAFFNEWDNTFQQPLLRRHFRIKFFADNVQPPGTSSVGTYGCQSMLLQKSSKNLVFLQQDTTVSMKEQHCTRRRLFAFRNKDVHSASVEFFRLPPR